MTANGQADAQRTGRYWLTAKGLRALGRPVPRNVPDDEVVELIERTAE